MIRFGIIRFGSVNDTEASVFGYSVSTRFDRPLDYAVDIEILVHNWKYYLCVIYKNDENQPTPYAVVD